MVLGNNELLFEVFAVLPLSCVSGAHERFAALLNRLVNSLIFTFSAFFGLWELRANWGFKEIDTWLIYSIFRL